MYAQYAEELVTVDIFNLCRICMQNHKHLAYFNIFGKCIPNNDVKLSNALEQLTSIKVYKSLFYFSIELSQNRINIRSLKFREDSKLPARICSSCESRVIAAYMLKLQTERTTKKLIELIKPDKGDDTKNLSGKRSNLHDEDSLTGKTILKQGGCILLGLQTENGFPNNLVNFILVDKSSYIINYESDDIAIIEVDQTDSDSATTNDIALKRSGSVDEQVAIAKSEECYSDTEHEIIYLDGSECGNDEHEQNEVKYYTEETEAIERHLPKVQQSTAAGECLFTYK